MDESYEYQVRRKIHDFMAKNKRRPKFLIVGHELMNQLKDEKDYIYEHMLTTRGKGDHFQGLMVCSVEHGSNKIFEVA